MQKFEAIIGRVVKEPRPRKKKHKERCNCPICKRTRKFYRYLKQLKPGPTKKAFFERIYDDLELTEFDLCCSQINLDKFRKTLGETRYREIYNSNADQAA